MTQVPTLPMATLYCLEFLCYDVKKTQEQFTEKLGLVTVGKFGQNLVLRRNKIMIALKPAGCEQEKEILQKSGTICDNVVFRVSNIQVAYEIAYKAGAKILTGPETLSDSSGTIQTFTIQSPFTNVVHTIVDSTNYGGVYFPGYKPYTCNKSVGNSGISHVDHIAFACNTGDSETIVRWYENCFGFTQFRLGADSDDLTVDYNGGGIKLLAMEYWRCAEKGVKSLVEDGIVIVVVESLPNSGEYNSIIN